MNIGPTIDATGISAPNYADILQSLIDSFRSIYGSDVYLGADSQDYEFLALMAATINDANQAAISAFISFSPTYALGEGLSSLVKINGIRRKSASYSTANLTIVGEAGAVINSGIVGDSNGKSWALPTTVVIGALGVSYVTGTATEIGAINALANTITKIQTPTRGWQSVTNAAASVQGNPVETDAELRRRQAKSVSLPATAILASIDAAIGMVPGVDRYIVHENDTDSADVNGIPAHSISAVVEGGDAQAIAEAIAGRKPPGIQTYGTTSRNVSDSRTVQRQINFFALAPVDLKVEVTINRLSGYLNTTDDLISACIQAFISGTDLLEGIDIGEDSYLGRLYSPAGLQGDTAVDVTGLTQAQLDVIAKTYQVTGIRQAKLADAFAAADVAVAFNEAADCDASNVTLIKL